jgi:nicotinate phosphoribosyltransferase
MNKTQPLYAHSLALLTDLYQLTMAYGYWKSGTANKNAVFHLFYRKNPFEGGYAIAAGLQAAVEVLDDFHFSDDDVDYLGTLNGNNGKPLFEAEFLGELRSMKFTCDIDAVPEGTIVFPHEPLVRVRGPIVQCQILETFLLNVINFQTLIAIRCWNSVYEEPRELTADCLPVERPTSAVVRRHQTCWQADCTTFRSRELMLTAG